MSRLAQKVAALEQMSLADLKMEWSRVYRATVPNLSPDLLHRGIAWKLQEKRMGGLSADARRIIRRSAGCANAGKPPAPRRKLTPGTRLMREWHGRSHVVLVTDDGFLFEDRPYLSLTRIARDITGTRWSGPRFFGLVS